MSNTALGAERVIIFINDAHEKFYHEKLKKVRCQDEYHKALIYCLGINNDTRKNINRIYNFKTGCVKTECLREGRPAVVQKWFGWHLTFTAIMH